MPQAKFYMPRKELSHNNKINTLLNLYTRIFLVIPYIFAEASIGLKPKIKPQIAQFTDNGPIAVSKISAPTVISANRLTDGTVAYLDTEGNWVGSLADARIFAAKDEESVALAAARRAVEDNLVLEPVVVELALTPAGWRAKSLRDRIRIAGPTVRETAASRSRHVSL